MGNSASSSRAHTDNSVDYGFLVPQGVYSGNPDWNQQIVAQLIADRRLAPFYRPLEDYDENWDDDQILAARKQLPDQDVAPSDSGARTDGNGSLHTSTSRSSSIHPSNKRPGALKEPSRLPEATVYRGAVECPICFLYYPPNINHSRCCDQAICTECFVQIKRSEPTTTHVVSEPAACPYCVQDNFGVTYTPPQWRAGIGSDGTYSPINGSRASSTQSVDTNKSRRKSFGADSAEVVTIDQIRPDWEAKLAAVRAAVARRANRRIIMRQVGDRLIPVGVTSGRIHPLTGDAATNGEQGAEQTNENEGRGGRRSRRRQHQQQPQDLNQLIGTMGMGGQDIEELMIMEAMRLSLIEHEEQQRKEAEEKKKKEAERIAKGEEPGEGSTNGEIQAGPSSSATASGIELPSIPTTSPIDVTNSSSRGLHPLDSSSPSHNSSSFGSRSSPASSNADLTSGSRQLGPSPLGAAAPGAGAETGTSLGVSAAQSRSRSHSRTASASSHAPTPREGVDPPPFSMLSAALAAHGAASAVLASSGSGASASELAPANTSETSAKTSTPSGVTHAPDSVSQAASTSATAATPTLIPVGAANQSLSSLFAESVNVANQSYDALPSSPDSPSHRPLLLETPASENPGSESVFGPGGD